MVTFSSLLIVLVVIGILLYYEVSSLPGSVVVIAAWLLVSLMAPWMHHPVTLIVLGAILILLNLPLLRRLVITRALMRKMSTMMPTMSDTERGALEAGTTWWEKELFGGRPDWQKYAATGLPRLSDAEQSFIDNEVEQLCAMLDEWTIHHELKRLPEDAWQFMKERGFFGLIIPREYGGREFSPFAQSCVMTKLATRSLTAAVTAMVPNSLGPGELLLHYGTDAQRRRWLPGLADGSEIPCFGLTGPEAGSDAGAIPDVGVVCRGAHDGEEVLGIRLTFAKRWITLAPVATVIGLAFKLEDPDHLLGDSARSDYGITLALVPASHPGVEIGNRHDPGAPFMNGPIHGRDVFVPLDWIIGGVEMAGKGWQMLMECLAAGRGISLPALATASGIITYRSIGAYARIREQFNVPVGEFEGVQEATAEVASLAYTLEAMRHWVTRGLAEGTPAVVSAIAKSQATEMMRVAVNHGMDVLGGRGIQLGPRNPLGLAYHAVPIAITVEGANILTRSLMIFGQGALRCHPLLLDEMVLLGDTAVPRALERFDILLFRHFGYTASRIVRMLTLGISGSRVGPHPAHPSAFSRPWYRMIDRFSAILAVTADVGMLVLGGQFKFREMLSARLGDVLSELFIASSLLKYHQSLPASEVNDLHAEYALQSAFHRAGMALTGFYDNFPVRWIGSLLKRAAFPWGLPCPAPSDRAVHALGKAIMEPSSVRDKLGTYMYHCDDPEDAIGRIEATYRALLEVEDAHRALHKAIRNGTIARGELGRQIAMAVEEGIIDRAQAEPLERYERMRYDCLLTDVFDRDLDRYLGGA